VLGIVTTTARVLAGAQAVERRIRATTSLALLASLTDVRAHVARLVHAGFVSSVGARRLPDLVRYLQAVDRRVEVLAGNPGRDRTLMWQVEQVQAAYDRLLASLPAGRASDEPVQEIRWMIEELRVSLWAQSLRTAYPVSDKRILRDRRAGAMSRRADVARPPPMQQGHLCTNLLE
jgi:ATP-dependent helicase HrpA